MKAKIGDLEVIHTQVLLIPDGLESWVEFKVLNWDVKLNIIMSKDSENPYESGFTIEPEDDYARIIFRNWDGDGMSFREPAQFGNTEDRNVSLMAFGHKVGNTLKIDLQVLLEGKK